MECEEIPGFTVREAGIKTRVDTNLLEREFLFVFELKLLNLQKETDFKITGPIDFDPCNGCDIPCHSACLRNAFRRGSFERPHCRAFLVPTLRRGQAVKIIELF